MTYPPPGPPGPPPGPPGSYPPPPPGNFPPPPPGYGAGPNALGNLPPEAYAQWFTRVCAFLIDVVPVGVIVGIAQVIVMLTGDTTCVGVESGYGGTCVTAPSVMGLLLQGVLSLAAFAFQLWNRGFKQGTTGQSLGKQVMKIKLVSEATGQPIGFGMSFVRDLAHFVDSIICYVGYLFPLWDAKRQTIADKLISTVVLPAPQ